MIFPLIPVFKFYAYSQGQICGDLAAQSCRGHFPEVQPRQEPLGRPYQYLCGDLTAAIATGKACRVKEAVNTNYHRLSVCSGQTNSNTESTF